MPGCHTSFTRGCGCGSEFVNVLNIAQVENLEVYGHPTSQTASRKICLNKIPACAVPASAGRTLPFTACIRTVGIFTVPTFRIRN